jgi:beta-lactamase class D
LLEVNDSSKIILYSNSCLKSEKNHKAWWVGWMNLDSTMIPFLLQDNNEVTTIRNLSISD